MLYNSDKQSERMYVNDILRVLDDMDIMSRIYLRSDNASMSFYKHDDDLFDVEINGDIAVDFDKVVVTGRYGNILTFIGSDGWHDVSFSDMCLNIPSGWMILTENGLVRYGSYERLARRILDDFGIDALEIDYNLWLDDQSDVYIAGHHYTPSDALKLIDPDAYESAKVKCICEGLSDFGGRDVPEQLEGVLFYWDDDDMTLTSCNLLLDGLGYAPGHEPNFIKEWEA